LKNKNRSEISQRSESSLDTGVDSGRSLNDFQKEEWSWFF